MKMGQFGQLLRDCLSHVVRERSEHANARRAVPVHVWTMTL